MEPVERDEEFSGNCCDGGVQCLVCVCVLTGKIMAASSVYARIVVSVAVHCAALYLGSYNQQVALRLPLQMLCVRATHGQMPA